MNYHEAGRAAGARGTAFLASRRPGRRDPVACWALPATASPQARIEPATGSKRNSRHSMGAVPHRDAAATPSGRIVPGSLGSGSAPRPSRAGPGGGVGTFPVRAAGAGRSPAGIAAVPPPTGAARRIGRPARAPGCARRTARLSIHAPAGPGGSASTLTRSSPVTAIERDRPAAGALGVTARRESRLIRTKCRWRRSGPGSRAPAPGPRPSVVVRGSVGERP